METIVAGLISSVSAIVICVITQMSANRKSEAKIDKQTALIEYKMDELAKRVEKHNNLVERTYKLEELTAVQEEQIKVANHRIQDLERREVV